MRTVPFRRSANRSNLFLGGDREVVQIIIMVSAILLFLGQIWSAFICGLVLLVGGIYLARLAAKADPMLRHVFSRQLRYRRYYPARSTPHVRISRTYK